MKLKKSQVRWTGSEKRRNESLDWDNQETPAQAFERKMPPLGKAITDGRRVSCRVGKRG